MPDRFIPLGEIVTTHGIDGRVKFKPYNPDTTVLTSTRDIFLEKNGARSAHCVKESKPYRGQFLIKLRGVDTIDDALKWVGSILSIPEEALSPLEPGEYYQYQAIGLEVFDKRGERVGVVTGILPTAGGELYVVQGPEREHLIPAVREIIERVDLEAGRIVIDAPPGLLDL